MQQQQYIAAAGCAVYGLTIKDSQPQESEDAHRHVENCMPRRSCGCRTSTRVQSLPTMVLPKMGLLLFSDYIMQYLPQIRCMSQWRIQDLFRGSGDRGKSCIGVRGQSPG